jgi:glycosyltransferase involved in cell wall biosynthesis
MKAGSAQPGGPQPALRVLMFDTLGATNDYANELILALAAQPRLELTVLTLESSRLPADTPCRVLRLLPDFGAPEPAWAKAAKLARAYAALWRAAVQRPRDTIVHVQFFKFAWLEAPMLLALRGLGVRVVFTAHNALPHVRKGWHAGFYRWWYGRVDAVHVLSASVEHEIRQGLGAQPRSLHRIGHGPYQGLRRRFAARMGKLPARARLHLRADDFVVLQYGLFRDYKGVDVLLRALCRVPPQRGVHLLLAGGGYAQDLARYRAIAQDAGRLDDLTWLDRFVSDEELCDGLAAADLVVFPYRAVSQSGALYLALTFGKPCIASDLPGFREMLPDADDAFFKAGSDVELAQRLIELQQDAARLERLRAQIESHGREHFDWQVIAQQTVAMYRSLQARARP